MKQPTIGFIGAGNMAKSLIGGLLAVGHSSAKIWASCPTLEHVVSLKQRLNINTSTNNKDVAENVDIIVFAVKPQILPTVANELAEIITRRKPLVISIAACVTEHLLRQWLGKEPAIVRCMPNTPTLVGCGASALYANEFASVSQKNSAEEIMRAVGITIWLDDEKIA